MCSVTTFGIAGKEVTELHGAVLFVLKDGTEIHQIGPPTEVYDYETGEPCGRVDSRGDFCHWVTVSPR